MSDSTAIAIAAISALGSVLASVASGVMSLITHKNIEQLKDQTNGMKDALVKVTGQSEYAKGLKQGQEEPKE